MSVFDHVYYPFHHDHINTPRKHPPHNPLWTSDGWGGVAWKLGGGYNPPWGGLDKSLYEMLMSDCFTCLCNSTHRKFSHRVSNVLNWLYLMITSVPNKFRKKTQITFNIHSMAKFNILLLMNLLWVYNKTRKGLFIEIQQMSELINGLVSDGLSVSA